MPSEWQGWPYNLFCSQVSLPCCSTLTWQSHLLANNCEGNDNKGICWSHPYTHNTHKERERATKQLLLIDWAIHCFEGIDNEFTPNDSIFSQSLRVLFQKLKFYNLFQRCYHGYFKRSLINKGILKTVSLFFIICGETCP